MNTPITGISLGHQNIDTNRHKTDTDDKYFNMEDIFGDVMEFKIIKERYRFSQYYSFGFRRKKIYKKVFKAK